MYMHMCMSAHMCVCDVYAYVYIVCMMYVYASQEGRKADWGRIPEVLLSKGLGYKIRNYVWMCFLCHLPWPLVCSFLLISGSLCMVLPDRSLLLPGF